jgi:plastocyanin
VKKCAALFAAMALASIAAAAASPSGALEATVSDEAGSPVDDAVVYLAANAAGRTPPGATMDQVGRTFVPAVLPVEVGTAVQFPNRDTIKHHVYSLSPAKKFEIKLYSGTPPPVVFDKPGEVVIGCGIHDWMVAHIFVAPSPYFARTSGGRALLRDVPAGSHELRVWHPRMRAATETTGQKVMLAPGQPGRVTFTLPLTPERKLPRMRRYDTPQG